MFTLDGIRRFHAWTHACFSLLLDHLSTLPLERYTHEIPNFGFNTIQKQVVHVLNCEGLWISSLQQLDYSDRNPAEFPTIAEVVNFQQETRRRTEAYLSTLTDAQLNTDTGLRFPDGDRAVRTPALVFHHVFTHAFHHKGQIVAMCRAVGYPAPDTDLNHFQ